MGRKKKDSDKPNIDVPEFLRDAVTARLDDPDTRSRWPRLYDVMVPKFEGTKQTWGGGRLSVRCEGASWIVSIEVAQAQLSSTMHCVSLTTAFDVIERCLEEDTLFWGPSWQKRKKKLPTLDEVV